jgi:hypothetical protein
VLSPFDDYPIHQVAAPIAHAGGGHPDFYDRFWFNGYTDDFFFAVALGTYRNRGVIDAAFSVVCDGRQRSVFASGRAPADPSVTRVGPIAIDIVEPMRMTRITVDAPDQEMSAELLFQARTAAYEEPRQSRHQGARLLLDLTRATQFGMWTGRLSSGRSAIPLDGMTVWGTKDRSWGIRPVGDAPLTAPSAAAPQLCFFWAPINFDDMAIHYIVFEDGDGVPWSEGGAVLPVIGPGEHTVGPSSRFEPVHSVALAIEWENGLRRSRQADLSFHRPGSDAVERIHLDPGITFRMSGAGYGHPSWSHGRWHDERAEAGEEFTVGDLDNTEFRNLHVQQVMRASWGDRIGLGVLEQLVIGPHRARGLHGLNDGAGGAGRS